MDQILLDPHDHAECDHGRGPRPHAPVMLRRDDYDLWLDPGMTNVDAVSGLLKPFDARLMRAYPVSSRVNQVQNDDAECSRPVTPTQIPQGQLFGDP